MSKMVLALASVALAMLFASCTVLAQSIPPEHPYYEFAAKRNVDSPEGIAVDSQGKVYVVDTANDRVQRFTSDGDFVTKWGGFGLAQGIAVDSHGNVFVSDWFDASVKRFTSEGELVTRW